ncbi:MAG: 3-deoxy-manno-octulosonate cytidylyltransferase [Legionellales bacterium]|nr:3-deoxy-manno-octulosonate cytidylyltransferase [Legionellales bacterium]
MSYTIIIPARYQSTRLHAKPLQTVRGKPLIAYTYDNATKTQANRIIIATDHIAIKQVACSLGAEVVMTQETCSTGTDRVAEAAKRADLDNQQVIVNLQSDEPLLAAHAIDSLAKAHQQQGHFMSTLYYNNHDMTQFNDRDTVKVVVNKNHLALNFSRSPIPYGQYDHFKQHLGIYAYKRCCLDEYVSLEQPEWEKTESLEQLRALWHGKSVGVFQAELNHAPIGVDTPDDLERFDKHLELV